MPTTPLPTAPLDRPTAMRVDFTHCVRCELCDALLPGVLLGPDLIPVSPAALEAMAVCPTGAIVWREGEASVPTG